MDDEVVGWVDVHGDAASRPSAGKRGAAHLLVCIHPHVEPDGAADLNARHGRVLREQQDDARNPDVQKAHLSRPCSTPHAIK